MRGLTLTCFAPASATPLWLGAAVLFAPRARGIPKQFLASVELRDLELEAQYAEIRRSLALYRDESPCEPGQGQVRCPSCTTMCSDDDASCSCGQFLHGHHVFTCPDCSTVVPRDARDCGECGSAFWSPVNPPQASLTKDMVRQYLVQAERSGIP